MRRAIKPIKYFVIALILVFGLQASPLTIFSSLAAPLQQGAIHHVYIYDVTDVSFSVSWTTTTASNGIVNYGTSTPPGSSASDTVANTTTHYVQISGLTANTTYYISVESGGLVDDNGGSFYSVTTGPSLAPPTVRGTVFGYVFENNGTTPVPNAIVYLRLLDNDGLGSAGNSQWVTARTDVDGLWFYTLGGLRTSNLSAYFSYSEDTDNIQFVAQGGDKGVFGEIGEEYIIPVPSETSPAQIDFDLNAIPNAVTLTQFEAVNHSISFVNIALLVGFGITIVVIAALFKLKRVLNKPGDLAG